MEAARHHTIDKNVGRTPPASTTLKTQVDPTTPGAPFSYYNLIQILCNKLPVGILFCNQAILELPDITT